MGRTFRKMYADASRQKNVKQLSPTYLKWDKEGKQVIGAFIGCTKVQSRLGGPEYNQYLFETDEGRVKFALGRSADGDIGSTLVSGSIYAVTYQGKERIEGGKQVNRFNVEEVGMSDDLPEEGDEVSSDEKVKGKDKR